MLRTIIQVIAGFYLVCALALFVVLPFTWPVLVGAGVLVLGCIGERFYYRGGTVSGVGGEWRQTDERFLDEESGQPVAVWFNATTGERRYVEQGAPPPA